MRPPSESAPAVPSPPGRVRLAGPLATAVGLVVLTDVLRVFLPSIITIFGQAAATPAELLGGFALLWFVLPLAAPLLIRAAGARRVALAAALLLAAGRLYLPASGGGQPQLYVAGVALLAGLCWLAAMAGGTAGALWGVPIGLVVATVQHAALATYDSTWRAGPFSWLLIVLTVALFLAAQTAVPAGGHRVAGTAAGPWLLVGPVLLLWLMVAGAPAVAGTGVSYLAGAFAGDAGLGLTPPGGRSGPAVVLGLAVGLFVAGWLFGRGPLARWAYPVLLVAGAAAFATDRVLTLLPAVLLTAAGLGGCLSRSRGGPPATPTGRALAVAAGMLFFAVAAVAYYAAYDLGYPNRWVPVLVAVLIAAGSARHRDVPAPPPAMSRPRLVAVSAALATLAGLAAPHGAHPTVAEPSAASIRLVAYNVRMGFGLDGRFDLDGLGDVLTAERPDVVALSEVDRGWLLNGGHDGLALLAGRLGMRYVFAPAADALWGDAVLTRLPVVERRTARLPADGAPTGAQALGVVLRAGGTEVAVVGTHLQPPPDGGPVIQAEALARFSGEVAAGRPLVVAGDLNTRPGDPAFAALTRAGLVDALAAARPLPTSPADAPAEEIDHVLVSPGIVASAVTAPRSTASDHLAVAVTLDLG